MTPVEITIPDQVVEGGPQRQAGNAEVGRELALGRDRLPNLERLDEVEDAVARLLLLTHARPASGIGLQPNSSAKVKHRFGKWSIPLFTSRWGPRPRHVGVR